MIPGQGLVEQPTTQVKVGVDPMRGKGLLPQVETELVGPAVKAAAQAVGHEQGRSQTPLAAGKHSFEKGEPRIVPFELDAGAPQLPAEQLLTCLGLLQAKLSGPLKRSVRFRDEG